MNFLLIGRDGEDAEAPARRQAAREAHLAKAAEMQAAGQLLYAVAMKTEAGAMIGSTMVYEAPNRETLDAWLREEPYITGDVWREIEIHPAGVPPLFQSNG